MRGSCVQHLTMRLNVDRNTKAAKRFLGKALRGWKDWELPEVLNTDKVPTYAGAIAELKAEGKCSQDTRHRQVKYLNNVVEADHGKLKLLIRPVHGFKTLKTAYATIKDFEVMRALRKGQARVFALQDGIVGEARDRRACLWRRTVRFERSHRLATGPSGQRRNIRRTRFPDCLATPHLRGVCDRAIRITRHTGETRRP